MHLSAACSHVVDILQYTESIPAVHGKIVFAYVLRLGQFEACRTWGSIVTIKSS